MRLLNGVPLIHFEPMMTEPIDSSSHSAEILGLPIREQSHGRDLLERIASKYLDEIRAGRNRDIEPYVAEHPEIAAEIRELLPLVAAMETWKSQQEMQTLRRPLPETFEITRLGDCRIVREIARGGMGVVFEAVQESISRSVAVKLLPWRFPENSRWGQQFQSEARTAAGLQHAHIVPVYSFGEDQQRYFYVMQLVVGVGLDKLIDGWSANDGAVDIVDLIAEIHPTRFDAGAAERGKRILRHDSWQQLGKIAAQIASALRYAHRQGTLHRDIKPANLLIDAQGKTWVTDFGLAMARDQAVANETESIAGTIRYMAPEQFRGVSDERTDLYAFGVTLYELTTLSPPFCGNTREEVIAAIQAGNPVPLRELNPEIPEPWEAIVQKAMAHDPDRRYQSADELHADLLSFVNSFSQKPRRTFWQMVREWF